MNMNAEKLIYIVLSDINKKVLLYTLNEPYNEKEDYIKIYASEFTENDEPIESQMSDEVHQEVRKAIASIGREEIMGFQILAMPPIDLSKLNGKPFAIPKIFKECINNVIKKADENLDNDRSLETPIVETFTDQNSVSTVQPNEDSANLMQETPVTENVPLQNEQVSAETDIANEPKMEEDVKTESDEPAIPEIEEEYNITAEESPRLDSQKDEPTSLSVTDFSEHPSENAPKEEITESNNAPLDNLEVAPSLEDLENALDILNRYIKCEKQKSMNTDLSSRKTEDKPYEVESSGEVLSDKDEVLVDKKDEVVANSDQLINPFPDNNNVFPVEDSSFFVSPSEDRITAENVPYVATSNIGEVQNEQKETLNSSINANDSSVEPVVMPDNFVGKSNPNFDIEGLGPSTLNSDGDIFKFVA